MAAKLLIHLPAFRILAFIVVGAITYLLILLGFGSIGMLRENFFSIELMLCILISALVLESLRVSVGMFQKYFLTSKISTAWKVFIQILVSCAIAIALVTLVVSLYYRVLVGFIHFQTELVVFNLIFLFVSIVYNVLLLSLIYLNKANNEAIGRENDLKQHIEFELRIISKINPGFLFYELEHILMRVQSQPAKAAQMVQILSQVYRYVLLNKGNSLTRVKEELDHLRALAGLLNTHAQESFMLKVEGEMHVDPSRHLVAGTLHTFAMYLISKFMVIENMPFQMMCHLKPNRLVVTASGMKRLVPMDFESGEMDMINRAFLVYTGQKVARKESDTNIELSVDLIDVRHAGD